MKSPVYNTFHPLRFTLLLFVVFQFAFIAAAILTPTPDMVLGLYHLTSVREGRAGEGRIFGSYAEAIMASDNRELHLQAKITIRLDDAVPPTDWVAPENWEEGDPIRLETTLGRSEAARDCPRTRPISALPTSAAANYTRLHP